MIHGKYQVNVSVPELLLLERAPIQPLADEIVDELVIEEHLEGLGQGHPVVRMPDILVFLSNQR